MQGTLHLFDHFGRQAILLEKLRVGPLQPFLSISDVLLRCVFLYTKPSVQAEIIFRPYLGPRPHEPQLNKCVARRVRNEAFGVLQGRQTDGNFKVVYLNHEIMTLSLSLFLAFLLLIVLLIVLTWVTFFLAWLFC